MTIEADLSGWVTVRSLTTNAGSEATPTTGSAFVEVAGQPMPRVEVRAVSGSIAGSPTSVTLAIWRKSGGFVDKLGTWEIQATDIATPIPQMFESYDQSIYVTVESFSGGSAQTLTATIQARGVFGG